MTTDPGLHDGVLEKNLPGPCSLQQLSDHVSRPGRPHPSQGPRKVVVAYGERGRRASSSPPRMAHQPQNVVWRGLGGDAALKGYDSGIHIVVVFPSLFTFLQRLIA